MRRIPINNAHMELRYNAMRKEIEISIVPDGHISAPVFFMDAGQASDLVGALQNLVHEHQEVIEKVKGSSPWAK